MERRKTYRTLSASCCALAAAAALAACGGVSSSASSSKSTNNSNSSNKASTPASAGNGAVLTVESSQQNDVTQNFNPFVQTSASTLLGATSLLYEPLLQANTLKPGMYYPWLATGYKWSDGGKAITFTIRPGVKWSDGTPLTAADVAFTYELIKNHPDANTTGLAVKDVSSSGNNVTITFASPQYANLQNIAGQVYIVPQSVWSKVGDPGKYTDANPVGSGPYTLASFTGQGFTLARQSSLLGRSARRGQGPVPHLRVGQLGAVGAADRPARLGRELHSGRPAGVRVRQRQPPRLVPAGADQQPGAEPDEVPDQPAGRCARRSAWPSTAPRSASRPRAGWSRRWATPAA